MTTLESHQDTHTRAAVTLQLHMEDMSSHNDLRLRGLLEATGPEDLAETVVANFWILSDDTFPADLASAPGRQIHNSA